MRLNTLLSEHFDSNKTLEIESFINRENYKRLEQGDVLDIKIGSFYIDCWSEKCSNYVRLTSINKLHCMIVSNNLISIDSVLVCGDFDTHAACENLCRFAKVWYLVEIDDIFKPNIMAKVIKYNFKLPEDIKLSVEQDPYAELLQNSQIAFNEGLGAGAVIYLRSAFEKIVHIVGDTAGIEMRSNNGRFKPFYHVLKAVNDTYRIIPEEFSSRGYELFGILSEIAHGNSTEKIALEKYNDLRRLVVGIIENVKKNEESIRNSQELKDALNRINMVEGND